MVKKLIFILFLFFILNIFAFTQVRVAVIPFEAKNTSPVEAEALTTVFENTLVNLNVFSVIEQNQIEEILKAQTLSLSGCTDDSCAVEIGELLSAEQIILGSLSKIGNMFLLTAKIIDVEKGKNIKADDVQAYSIDEMIDQARALAYSLAGMKFQYQGTSRGTESFGEIFVSTEPEGAEIYINGKSAGVAPNLFSNIPVGDAIVEARRDNYYLSNEVKITGTLNEHHMILEEVTGSLFINSTYKNIDVFLDKERLGELNKGLFKGISIGEHNLEMMDKLNGLYWQEQIEINPEITTRIDATPYGIGRISYSLPSDVDGLFFNEDHSFSLHGYGEIGFLPIGEYNIEVEGEKYKSIEDVVVVEQNKTVSITPILEYSDEYAYSLQVNEWTFELKEFELKVNDAFNKKDLESANEFLTELKKSAPLEIKLIERLHTLISEGEKLILDKELQILHDELDSLIAKKEETIRVNEIANMATWAGFGTSITATLLLGTGIVIAEMEYLNYQKLVNSEELVISREKVQLWDNINLISGVSAGVTAAIGAGSLLFKNDTAAIDADIARVSMKIAVKREGITSE